MYDIITIGGATQDIFVETDEGKIFNVESISEKQSYLCFDYGAKIELDKSAYDIGGGAANTAVNFSNLGLKTGIVVKVGKDIVSQAVFERLNLNNIDTSMIITSKKLNTGFSVILTSYEGDRTVLTHRGANSSIKLENIDWEKIKQAKWLYVASLSGNSNHILDKFAEFAEENGVNMAFNPGTTQIKKGLSKLHKVLEKAEILILNRDEASMITDISNRPPETPSLNDGNLFEIISKLKNQGSKIVVITEGKNGSYAYDGKTLSYCPPFPAKVVSTLGAGDAFASTFTAAMIRYENNIAKSLQVATINSSNVVQSFGAQTGLKTFEELEEILKIAENLQVLSKNI